MTINAQLMVALRIFLNSRWQLPTLLVLSAVWTTSAIQPFRAIDVLKKHGSKGARKSSDKEDVQELYLEQLLDHFSQEGSTPNGTFWQRYFYSNRYAKPTTRPNAPVYAFLCVGGEGPSLDRSVLVDSVHCSGDMIELARMIHEGHQATVHLFALEHRYYGSSYPGRYVAVSTCSYDSSL